MASRDGSGHLVVAGSNYGQGSSREHAVIAPRYLGLRAVLAVSFARIHWQNLANFGVLALEFTDPEDYQSIEQGDVLILEDLRNTLRRGSTVIRIHNSTRGRDYSTSHRLSVRQVRMVLAGGLLPAIREREEESHRSIIRR
jgi:aconitate hydratase